MQKPKQAVLAAFAVLSLPSLRADTVFLKNGDQILDCKVVKETDAQVSLRTPVGDMVVPRTEIHRILKVKTTYDRYEEQLANIREGDVNGLFKLATWCRTAHGLRKESDDLLVKVIALKENHAEARRMLGHLKLGGQWVVPPPLSLRLKGSGPSANDLRKSLGLFLKMRKDVTLAPESDSKVAAGNPLDHCALAASVVVTRKAAGTFYGMTIGQPTYAATVRLEAQSPWLGKSQVKTAVDGQVPGVGGNQSLAVQNAVGSGSRMLHQFLDQLTELRLRKLEEEFKKGGRDKKAPEAPQAKA